MNTQIDIDLIPKPRFDIGQEVWWIENHDGRYGKSQSIHRSTIEYAELRVEYSEGVTKARMSYYSHVGNDLAVKHENELAADFSEILPLLQPDGDTGGRA